MIALVLSNALIGLSGALICQSQKYADIGMGTGAIVIGLAAIVIGEVLGRLLPGGLTQFSVRLAPPSLAPWCTSSSAPSCCNWAWTPTT